MTTTNIRFLLDQELISLSSIDPNLTVLKYLREQKQLSGTKEGCGSGDCGACTVVVAELSAELSKSSDPSKISKNQLSYRAINSCITLLANLHGKQLITVENLKRGKQLHPIQQSLVENHGSQCGFCTPGIVMSSFALSKNNRNPNRSEVVEALAGNLCRCTGYRSIIDATIRSTATDETDSFTDNYQATIDSLSKINKSSEKGINIAKTDNVKGYYAPNNALQLSQYLFDYPNSTLIAGGTDLVLSISQNLVSFDQLVYLGEVIELNKLEESDNQIIIGSAVTYSRLMPLLQEHYPEFAQMVTRIGSTQIRNNGTLAGNIANASPIGDMPPVLIALGAQMILQHGNVLRQVAVEKYFTGYKQTILQKSEFIREIIIDKTQSDHVLKVYKISKRFDDDISTVLAGILISVIGNRVTFVRIAFGGMAEIPKRAKHCESALLGNEFNCQTIELAQRALCKDFQPLSDVRASSDYRIKIAQNIIQKCYLELTQPELATRIVDHA